MLKDKRVLELTDEQKAKVLRVCKETPDNHAPSIKDCVQAAFGGEFDGRSLESKAVRALLCQMGIKPRASHEYVKMGAIDLSEEAKTYIANNAATMTCVEMARVLFKNDKLTNLNLETRTVKDYLDSLGDIVKYGDIEEIPDGKYVAFKSLSRAAAKVNKYVLDAIKPEQIEEDSKIRDNLKTLIKFAHTFRFLLIMNKYQNNQDRELFEGSFIRFVWDKPDLLEEEIDIYLNLCCDIVSYTNMQEELETLKKMRQDCSDDSDGKRLSMSIVESIANVRKEMDDNHKRQTKMVENLQGKRNERIENKIKENQSFLQVIEYWRDEKKRDYMLKVAEKRKKDIQAELTRLENLDSLTVEIFGSNLASFQ